MGAFSIEMSCRFCGADLVLVNEGKAVGGERNSIWSCSKCPAQWRVHIDMVPTGPQAFTIINGTPQTRGKVALCGTDAGYKRHLRNGATPCESCRIAHAQSVSDWAATKRKKRAGAFA